MKIISGGSVRTKCGQYVFMAHISPSLHWVASGKVFARMVIAAKKAPSCAFETSSSSSVSSPFDEHAQLENTAALQKLPEIELHFLNLSKSPIIINKRFEEKRRGGIVQIAI